MLRPKRRGDRRRRLPRVLHAMHLVTVAPSPATALGADLAVVRLPLHAPEVMHRHRHW
jgi:hypothetical protein